MSINLNTRESSLLPLIQFLRDKGKLLADLSGVQTWELDGTKYTIDSFEIVVCFWENTKLILLYAPN